MTSDYDMCQGGARGACINGLESWEESLDIGIE